MSSLGEAEGATVLLKNEMPPTMTAQEVVDDVLAHAALLAGGEYGLRIHAYEFCKNGFRFIGLSVGEYDTAIRRLTDVLKI